jgi:hypothetical protein
VRYTHIDTMAQRFLIAYATLFGTPVRRSAPQIPHEHEDDVDARFSRTLVAPGVQASDAAPTDGDTYLYHPPSFLEEQGMVLQGPRDLHPITDHDVSDTYDDGKVRRPYRS